MRLEHECTPGGVAEVIVAAVFRLRWGSSAQAEVCGYKVIVSSRSKKGSEAQRKEDGTEARES